MATSPAGIFLADVRTFTASVSAQDDVQSWISASFAKTSNARDHQAPGLFSSIDGVVRDKDVAIEVDLPHFFLERKRTGVCCSTVFTALNETILPDLVLNFTVVGLATVFVATNLTALKAMIRF